MTDSEIVKALECCPVADDCYECECKEFCPQYMGDLIPLALDLITRQKAEIERLKANLNIEFEKFASEYDNKIKAEAVKEFTKRLKEKLGDCHIVSDEEYCGFDCGDIHKCIDNLLKETVGEKKWVIEIGL